MLKSQIIKESSELSISHHDRITTSSSQCQDEEKRSSPSTRTCTKKSKICPRGERRFTIPYWRTSISKVILSDSICVVVDIVNLSLFSVEARIEQIYSTVSAQQNQIKSQFKVALLKLPRNVRSLKVEDHYYGDDSDKDAADLTLELAKVAASVASSVSKEVSTTVRSSKKKISTIGGKRRATKKKSSILAAAPSSIRRSTRKRFPSSRLVDDTPLASSTLTAAALGLGCTTAKSSRSRMLVASTPLMSASSGMPVITPKFDMATPLTRTAMRTKRDDEKWLVSVNGSPVYIGSRGGKSKAAQDKMIPIPLGNGKTIMVPADDPEVQPLLQKLVETSMDIMNRS